MPASRTSIAVAVLAACVAAGVTARRLYVLRRALYAERAARRLTSALQHHDLDVFAQRLRDAVHADRTLSEAGEVLDIALAHHDPEGGPL